MPVGKLDYTQIKSTKYLQFKQIILGILIDNKVDKSSLWPIARQLNTVISEEIKRNKNELHQNMRKSIKKAIVKKIPLPNRNTVLIEVTKDFVNSLKGKL